MAAARDGEAVGTGSLALTGGGSTRGLAPPAVASVWAKGEAVA